MEVIVDGFSGSLKDDIIEASAFYGNILFHEKVLQRILVYIDCKPDHELVAETHVDDLRGRIFTIELRNLETDDPLLQTLAHEMVHVKQLATRELTYRTDPLVGGFIEIWKGRIWRPRPNEHPYFDCPWECDAFGREAGLYHRWKAYKGGRSWK